MWRLFVLTCCIFFATCTYADKGYVVTDYRGRGIHLSEPAQRIVAMAPHIVENIFSAGAGDLVVGRVEHSDYPEETKFIANIGAAQGFSLEAITKLQADLLIIWGSGYSSDRFAKLKELGIPVYVDEPKTLRDIGKSIRDIGVLTGRTQQANQAADDYLFALARLQKHYGGAEKVDVFYQVWDKPLQTINQNSIISDVINLCGGHNIYADAPVIAPKVSLESVLQRNPQAIVASGYAGNHVDWFKQWSAWSSITAVKNQNLFYVPPNLIQRHTVRLLQGAQILCKQLAGVRLN